MCTRALKGSGKSSGIVWQRRGILFLGLCRLRGKRVGRLELLLEYNLGFFIVKCGEWTTKRAKIPCGLIALTQGQLVVEIKRTKII